MRQSPENVNQTLNSPTDNASDGVGNDVQQDVRDNTWYRKHWAILLFYTLLSLVLTWPLPVRLTTWVPGLAQWAFDESTFMWNVWYFKDAVVDRLANPLHSELIYYPLGLDLILYTYNFFHALLAQPLMLAVNLPFGSNIAFLLSTILSGYGTYLLVLYLLGRHRVINDHTGAQLAAIGAGLLYAFASNRAVYATLGHYDMTTTQWIPFYILMFLRSLDGRLLARQRKRSAMWAGFFFALNGLAEMITALFLGMFTIIALIVYYTQRRSVGRLAPIPLSPVTDDIEPETPNRATRAITTASPQAEPIRPTTFRMIVTGLALTGVVSFALWAPALIPILIQFLTDDYSLQGWGEAIPLSVDLLGFLSPTVLHPIFGEAFYNGDLLSEIRRVQLRALEPGVEGFRDINTVFVGWLSLMLAISGIIIFRRQVRLWVWTGLVFGAFALGPFLQINGRYRFDLDGIEATFPLPYALLHYIPIIKANRVPNRNSVLLMLAIAVLAGLALYWLMQRLRRGRVRNAWYTQPRVWIGGLLCGLILFEHLALPYPLSDARIPPVYTEIAADPNPVSVMHMPLGWRDSFGVLGPEKTLLQYFQTEHQKPMLGGNISRAPDFKMGYFERIPLFQVMTDIQFGHCLDGDNPACISHEMQEQAAAQAEELMYLYNTAYVLLHPPIPQRYPYADHWEAAWDYTKSVLPLEPEPFYVQDGMEAYRVIQPPGSDEFTVRLGVAGSYPYRGEGWDDAEQDTPYELESNWATSTRSLIFVPLRAVDPGATYAVTARIHPFAFPGSPTQSVALSANGNAAGRQTLAPEWQYITWEIPGNLLETGINRLEFEWEYAIAPRTVIPGDRQIGTTGLTLPIDAHITAFDNGAFIALFDEAGNQIDGSAGRMGVNVTVLDPVTGDILAMQGFDTTANVFESEALADFINAVEPGRPVLVSTFGEASTHLEQSAIDALRTLGADISLDAVAGNHLAMVGLKGAEPGTAALEMQPERAFVAVSLNQDRRTLAGAVSEISVSR